MHRCETCGKSTNRLRCHEIWDYDESLMLRTLSRLQAVCTQCIEVIHMGLSEVRASRGELDIAAVRNHFRVVNGLTAGEAEDYIEAAFDLWEERSFTIGGKERCWRSDFGPHANEIATRNPKQ